MFSLEQNSRCDIDKSWRSVETLFQPCGPIAKARGPSTGFVRDAGIIKSPCAADRRWRRPTSIPTDTTSSDRHRIASHRITSHYITLHYITLHYITLHYITLHYITLHYITLHYITLHYITLHYTTLHYITLHYITLHYITLHYITLHYITLHYITLHYITLHYITLHYIDITLHRAYLSVFTIDSMVFVGNVPRPALLIQCIFWGRGNSPPPQKHPNHKTLNDASTSTPLPDMWFAHSTKSRIHTARPGPDQDRK